MIQHVLPEVNIPTNVEAQMSVSRFVRDPDHALETIFCVLEESHRLYFLQYREGEELPDVKEILDSLKSSILHGVSLVFSGLAPLHARMEDSHWWRLAEQYGATCLPDLFDNVTHVVSYRCDTSKVMCGVRRQLHIVTPEWILQSIFNWDRQPESNFRPPNLPPHVGKVESVTNISIDLDELNAEIDEFMDDSSESDGVGRKRQRPDETDDEQAVDKEVDDGSNFDSDGLVEELEQDLFY